MLDDLDIITNIMVNINSTALGKGSGDAWGLLVRRQLGGEPEEKIGDPPNGRAAGKQAVLEGHSRL